MFFDYLHASVVVSLLDNYISMCWGAVANKY